MLQKITSSFRDILAKKKKKKKFVFVHIPKTAGMTMAAVLETKFAEEEVCPIRLYPDLVNTPKEELDKYLLFRGHFPYDVISCILNQPFSCITILREPVARYYSYYKFMQKREDFEQSTYLANEIPMIRKMNFHEFTTTTNMAVVKDGLNQQCRYLGKKTPESITLPYKAEKSYPTAEEIERAKTRLTNMEAFGLVERFQDSLFLMSFVFGWEPIVDKLVLNTSGPSEISGISDDTRALVKEKNKPDVELYNFATTLFETRYQTMLATLVEKYGKKVNIRTSENLSNDQICALLEQNMKPKKKPNKK